MYSVIYTMRYYKTYTTRLILWHLCYIYTIRLILSDLCYIIYTIRLIETYTTLYTIRLIL